MSPEVKQAIEQQKQSCPFCRIVKGEIESKKIYENELFIAVLDINPAAKGHMLVMPKEHYPIMPLIPKETLEKLYVLIKELDAAVYKGLLCRSTVFIANGGAAGQQSNHFMMHVIPREDNDGLDAFNIPSNKLDSDAAEKAAVHLRNSLAAVVNKTTGAAAGTAAMPRAFSKEQLIGIIEKNPPLKKIIIEQPEDFKKMVPTHPQLGPMFEGKDVDGIIDEIMKRAGAERIKNVNAEAKEAADKEERKDNPENYGNKMKAPDKKETAKDKANLDTIAKLFS